MWLDNDMTTTAAAKQLWISRHVVLGGNTDEHIAVTADEMAQCQCCGRKIRKIDILSNGLQVGSECSTYLTRPDIRWTFSRPNRKADRILAEGGWR